MKIENHPDYPEYSAAHSKLTEQAQKNEKLIVEKLGKSTALTDSKRKALEVLNSQNKQTVGRIDNYMRETEAALCQTSRTLNFVRDGKFQDEVESFLAQLELVEMRIQAGVAGEVEYFDIYQCRERWHVSEATSTESIADFGSQQEAEAYAVKLRRRFRILSFLSEN